MHYFPITMRVDDGRVVFIGGKQDIVAKLRLLLKTTAGIDIYTPSPHPFIRRLAEEGRVTLHATPFAITPSQKNIALAYISGDDEKTRDHAIALCQTHAIPYCVIDDLARSRFITPALVDRDPVTIAISSEGTAPVLARRLKAMIEATTSQHTGLLARLAGGFRHKLEALASHARLQFWHKFFNHLAPIEINHGEDASLAHRLQQGMHSLLHQAQSPAESLVQFVSAGPGDPELLTLKARHALDTADMVIHDRLIPPAILELVRREATIIEAGKTGYAKSTPQTEINRLLVKHATSPTAKKIVRLKSGDASIYGRLDEEITALTQANIAYTIIPGITAASAAAAHMGVSLTKRGRNSALALLTARDINGFADHQWHELASPGAVAAIYMGARALSFFQSRLLMHGGDPNTPITIVSRASQPDAVSLATTLANCTRDFTQAKLKTPVIIMLGLAPHATLAKITRQKASAKSKKEVLV